MWKIKSIIKQHCTCPQELWRLIVFCILNKSSSRPRIYFLWGKTWITFWFCQYHLLIMCVYVDSLIISENKQENISQDSWSSWFWAEIWPHSKCKIVSYFPNYSSRFSNCVTPDNQEEDVKLTRLNILHSQEYLPSYIHQSMNCFTILNITQ